MDVSTRTIIDIQVLSGKTEHVDILERTSMFPDLSTDYMDLRLEDIASDRYIAEDGFGTVPWGVSMLDWKVERVEVYQKVPCINVSLWMEPGTLSSNDLEEFSLNLLLADSLPVAMRSIVHMRTVPDVPNPYVLDIVQGMVGFRKGADPIIYGTIDSYHENTANIFSIYTDLISEYNEKWTYSPKQGTKASSIPSDFDAEDAIEKFSGKPAFKNFVQGLSDPFCLYANFSSQDGRGEMWKFSISDRSNPWGWNESVLKDSTVTSGFKTRIDPVGIGKDRIGGVLTFSGAETALKRLMVSIDQSYGKALYGMVPGDEAELDMDRNSIMLIADHRYPSIGLLNQGSFERIEYGMVIGSSDNEFEACIDMHSGQLMYLYSRTKV
jgi:hypothetical protein